MTTLIMGLFVFLGIHSLNIVAPAKRQALSSSMGAAKWKLIHSA
ncbi:MAG: NnrU family protein, partial [Gammaproteobacteria bacterium]|nr:NnrU family protein [Gammaproteobacteria bacterium]